MNRSERFAKKTLIYAIGTFGSKILSFLLLPLYTYLIPTAEYGKYDIILTIIALLLPVITLQIPEGIITAMIHKECKSEKIIKTSWIVVLLNCAVFSVFA